MSQRLLVATQLWRSCRTEATPLVFRGSPSRNLVAIAGLRHRCASTSSSSSSTAHVLSRLTAASTHTLPTTTAHVFARLRAAFHRGSSPACAPSSSPPHASPSSSSSSPILRRLLHSSCPSHGPRSYYPSSQQPSRSPPRSSSLVRRLNSFSPNTILYALIALNLAVFLAWQYAHQVYQQYRDPSLLSNLQNNFTTSWRNITQGRVWCLLTSCFSHEGTGHILMNLLSLYFMGPPVMMMLGNVGFLSLYLFSGAVASLTSLLFSRLTLPLPQSLAYSAHGASGAIYGCLSFFAAAYPRTTFLLFFVVPVPAWACVAGILGWDLYGALGRRGGTTDSAGHVGGVLAGLMWFALVRRGFRF
ncbi:BQ2448_4945 [Microbotryum intermedium]|uniref:BQ2448_4945 protein n=1 Tax=Microbotryum intermedium TaxID=269621 RepID=A0A238FJB9_9BASI|nr:BQ2448_4945 [Microbotryum intermedium]